MMKDTHPHRALPGLKTSMTRAGTTWVRKAWALAILCAVIAGVVLSAGQAPVRPDYRLTLVDRDGRRTLVGMVPGSTFAPRISPDGRDVVFDTADDGSIWIAKLSDIASRRRLTTGGRNRGPLWSGDGRRILYVTDHEGAETLFWRPTDAAGSSGTPELLTKPARAPESWPPGLQRFSFITFKDGGDYDVWTYSVAERRATAFAALAGSPQHSSSFSPDGRWIAYVSAESGRLEVYVQAFPGSGARIQVTKTGGGHPLWAPDQRELFFDNGGQVFVVAIRTEPSLTAGEPVALPIMGFVQGPLRRQYDLTPDGKQFLMLFRPGQ
jgi:Tol biopolymer transport system component